MSPPTIIPKRVDSAKSPHIVVVRVELTPTAKAQSASVADRLGMTQIATLSRLIEWFAGQPEALQAAVLGRQSDAGPSGDDVTRMIWEQKARSNRAR